MGTQTMHASQAEGWCPMTSAPLTAETVAAVRQALPQLDYMKRSILYRIADAEKHPYHSDPCSECKRLYEQLTLLEAVPVLLAAVEGAQQADRLNDLCQSEGPRGETICMLALGHEGPCGWERL